MRHLLFFYIVLCASLTFGQRTGQQQQQQGPPPKYEIPKLKYPTADTPVISYNIMDFPGADNTGRRDMAPLIKSVLARLGTTSGDRGGVGNGGVLFLPEGKYLLNSNLVIPKGVTLRGEWKKPEKGKPIVGTILMTDYGRGSEDRDKSLLLLQPTAAVIDLAIWYPRQNISKVTPYPPAIGFGQPGYFGNEYDVARNVTFVNAYAGCVLTAGGGAPNMFGIYGTPLKKGIQIDSIAEVGRVENVDFSPEYWAGSGLDDAPKLDAIKKWLRENGTGMIMARNDWSYVTDATVEGYNVGYNLTRLTEGPPNGLNAKMRFKDCRVAVLASNIATVGCMCLDVDVDDCDWGLFVKENCDGVLQLANWTINAKNFAIATDQNSALQLLVGQCTIKNGKIELYGGTSIFVDCDIDTTNPQLKIGPEAVVVMGGNRFSQQKIGVINRSLYECVFDAKPIENLRKMPNFEYVDPQTLRQKPDREVLYVATEFGARPNDNSFDNTAPLQKLLDQAGADGGGIVYLPPGKYRCLGHLTVPTGVELKGSVDVGSVPTGPGSILEIYEGKNKPTASPFLTMQERSGARGIVFNYPEQKFMEIASATNNSGIVNPHAYPYAVRVAGKDVYLIHLGFRATFSGVDMFTHKADNVYMEYPAGHIFTNGMHIGGGTDNARINNAQFNTIGYACGMETKFGCWPNGIDTSKRELSNLPAYKQNWRDLKFFILDECTNLKLFNNFHFGTHFGTIVGSDKGSPSGIVFGHGIDSAINAVLFNSVGKEGLDFIGAQVVAITKEKGSADWVEGCEIARYVLTTPDFKGTVDFFLGDYWGAPTSAVEVAGGQINQFLSRFDQSGREQFFAANPAGQGKLRVVGNSVQGSNPRTINPTGAGKRLAADYSIVSPGRGERGEVSPNIFASFKGNVGNSPSMSLKNMPNRNGWRALASGNENPNNMLDGRIDSRWGTGTGMKKGDWIAIDMRAAIPFNTVILNQGASGGDYPAEYEAFISEDGKKWGRALVSGQGTNGATVVRFPETQNARYVKVAIKTPKPGGHTWWSVAEIYVANLQTEKAESPF